MICDMKSYVIHVTSAHFDTALLLNDGKYHVLVK